MQIKPTLKSSAADLRRYAKMTISIHKIQVGIFTGSEKSKCCITTGCFNLQRECVINALVDLHLYLGKISGKSLNLHTVRLGIETFLNNPQLGECIVAWYENRILGQLEIKKPFEVWYNTSYWYVDNYVVFPEVQRQGVGTKMFDYVKELANAKKIQQLRLYVATQNIGARQF
jgi:GNAT superfamily N-acetyltransferase